jgi:hypothetical protein
VNLRKSAARFIIAALSLLSSHALAWTHGNAGIITNSALGGVVLGDTAMYPFVNFMREYALTNSNQSTFIYPNYLQTGSNLPTGTLPAELSYYLDLDSHYFGEWVFPATVTSISGGSGFQWTNFGTIYSISGNATVSGCTTGSGTSLPCYFANSVSINATGPYAITMDFSAPITGVANNGTGQVRLSLIPPSTVGNTTVVTIAGVVGSDGNGCGANGVWTLENVVGGVSGHADLTGSTFPGGCTASGGQLFSYQTTTNFNPGFNFTSGTTITGLTAMAFCKLADYNADNTCNTTAGKTSWPAGFNDDYVSAVAALKNAHLRYLDVNVPVFRIGPDWVSYRTTAAASWGNGGGTYWAKNRWFGSDSGTNSYSISCTSPCTYNLTSGAPADGDFIHFYNVNANTTMTPTLTLTDASSVTSSAIPMRDEAGTQLYGLVQGSPTPGDTIAIRATATPVGWAGPCLSGGTHTTSAYTVGSSDTIGNIGNQLVTIVINDTTLSAQPTNVQGYNPLGGSGEFFLGWASNACAVSFSAVITGAGTETVTFGTMDTGVFQQGLQANTLYSATYNALMKAWVVGTINLGGIDKGWPFEVQIDLAKAVSTKSGVQTGCWLQFPMLWSTASFTSLANYAYANQCPGHTAFELSNEVWNPGNLETAQAEYLANSVGLGNDSEAYYQLKQRQLWAVASGIYGGLGGHLHTINAFQFGAILANEINGSTLCGTSCGNQAYQNAIGVNYNASPNRPSDFTTNFSQAPYYNGSIFSGGNYYSAATYGSWSATNSSVAGNVLTVTGTVTGTIWWNGGISSCDGAFIKAPTPGNPTSAQLTGTVSKTVSGSFNNNTTTFTLNNTSGLSVGMWVYDQNNGMVNGTIGSINSGANQITIVANETTYQSATSSDTFIFGGLAGTYQLNSTTCSASSGTISGGEVLGMQYAIDNYNGLNGALGSQADALAWMYQDTLVSVLANYMHGPAGNTVQSLVAGYNAMNTAAPGVPVWDYEGGYQAVAPLTGQATSMGLPSASYGGATGYANTLLTAFKNSSSMKLLETVRHNNELAILAAGSMSMWYVDSNNGQWALYPNTLYYPPPFQPYNAIGCYNGNTGLC